MFARMKTGTKILAGFVISILIAVVVGWIGYRGLSDLSGHIDEFGMVRLPSVQALGKIADAHVTILAAENMLLCKALDDAGRQQRYARIQQS